MTKKVDKEIDHIRYIICIYICCVLGSLAGVWIGAVLTSGW